VKIKNSNNEAWVMKCVFLRIWSTLFLKKNKIYEKIKSTSNVYINGRVVCKIPSPNCQICGGEKIRRGGSYKQYRYWFCVDCQKYFKQKVKE